MRIAAGAPAGAGHTVDVLGRRAGTPADAGRGAGDRVSPSTVGAGEAVTPGDGVTEGDTPGDPVEVGVGVGDADWLGAGEAVSPDVPVGASVCVGTGVAVGLGVCVGIGEAVPAAP
jgi:hypothetical protein